MWMAYIDIIMPPVFFLLGGGGLKDAKLVTFHAAFPRALDEAVRLVSISVHCGL